MSYLSRALRAYAERQLPRVLTQVDRDPDSPRFGNFDRNHWHYKIRDFSSAILQQGAFTLDAVLRGDLEMPGDPQKTESWAVAAVNALASQVRRDGGVDEYFPYERSYPAAAFGLYAAARLALDWKTSRPELLSKIDWRGLSRLAAHLDGRRETEASNQQAAGLAALALAARLPEISPRPSRVSEHADRLFASQHAEGWFPEYGGPDFGYLTVTIDALVDYHDATEDPRALRSIDRAVEFLASLVGADGRLPSTLNSRNTDYVVPYGLARTGARNRQAAWLVETLFRDADDPGHFLWATDDRYHSHYVYASVVRALPRLDRMLRGEPPAERSAVTFDGAGYRIVWSADRTWSAAIGLRKGGLVRIHRRNAPPLLDHGWRVRVGSALWTSNWWQGAEARIEASGAGDDHLRIAGTCRKASFLIPTPWKHMALRLASRVLGARLLKPLRRLLIFKPQGESPNAPRFEREIEANERGVAVRDRVTFPPGATAERSPRQNLRHVASAESFHPEDLLAPIPARIERSATGLSAEWRFPQEADR
ncbi:MAG TPA: hypothetical protein VGS22_21705 [Thermoanaerobaculia bacterium]|jgi:hypothetical protein|nr:hypothetical protein [Thermoanaerobaculia bacterium]